MNVVAKNVKVSNFTSEETLCFEATIYVDGIRAFTAHNDGHGGPNMYYPITGKENILRDLEAYARSLPVIHDKTYNFDYQPDVDIIVGNAINTFRAAKNLGKLLKGKILFKTIDGTILEYGIKGNEPAVRNVIATRYPGAIIINDLQEREAMLVLGLLVLGLLEE